MEKSTNIIGLVIASEVRSSSPVEIEEKENDDDIFDPTSYSMMDILEFSTRFDNTRDFTLEEPHRRSVVATEEDDDDLLNLLQKTNIQDSNPHCSTTDSSSPFLIASITAEGKPLLFHSSMNEETNDQPTNSYPWVQKVNSLEQSSTAHSAGESGIPSGSDSISNTRYAYKAKDKPPSILRRNCSYVSMDSANASLDASRKSRFSQGANCKVGGVHVVNGGEETSTRMQEVCLSGLEIVAQDEQEQKEQELLRKEGNFHRVHSKTSLHSYPNTHASKTTSPNHAKDGNASSPSLRRNTSVVSFQDVNVREYDVTLGDNPSCHSGPALSLDWSFHERKRISVDEYETSIRDLSRVHKEPKRLHPGQREKILKLGLGFTEDELRQAEKESKKIQRERSVSSALSPFWRVEHAICTLKEKMQAKKNKKKKKMEKNQELDSSGPRDDLD